MTGTEFLPTAPTASPLFRRWWSERLRTGRFEVTRVPFAELESWSFDPRTGNLGHASGRFFTIEGVQVTGEHGPIHRQPIINQPEIGVLGVLLRDIGGVPHCLMQAKMEPGNVNTLQLSPTVQATRSNYTKVHRGHATRYLEYFTGPRRGRVVVDVLQSEQGAWFWHKRNRNMVVCTDEDVPVHEDFCWLPLPELRALLRVPNLVNMDTRTVLSCLPVTRAEVSGDAFGAALARSYTHPDRGLGGPLHPAGEVLSWFTEAKTRCAWHARLVPLDAVTGWSRGAEEITDVQGRDFRIIAVRVRAANREVPGWTQPLLYPRGEGLAIAVARPIGGVLHLLVHARAEFGLLDAVEIAPTVQLPSGRPVDEVEGFLREAATGRAGTVRFETVLSEEGGRFHHALTRYRVIEVGEEFPVDVPPDYCWVTVRQLMRLLRHGHYINVEARSLLACVHSI